MNLPPLFLPDLLRQAAVQYADRTAVDFLGRTVSFADLWRRVQSLAATLQAHGLTKGARIGLMLPNTPAYIEFYFATLLAGGVVVNINPLYSPHELQHIIEDSDPHMIVTLDLQALVGKLLPLISTRRLVIAKMTSQLPAIKGLAFRVFKAREIAALPQDALHAEDLYDSSAVLQPVPVDLEKDLAVLQYTGGTTGVSKAAMLSHANLSINAKQCRVWFGDARDGAEIALAVIPFFHAFALTTLVNLSVLMGTTIIALPRFDVKQVMKTIQKKRPTIFPAVPTIFATINNHADVGDFDLTSVKYCVSGGAPLPVEVKQSFENKTGCTLVEGYGLSEASPVVCANPLDGVNKAGSIGKAVIGTSIALRDLEDPSRDVALGEKGELWIKGPQVMHGYWRRDDETKHVLRDGWLRTGDVATMDTDGYVFIVDRMKDMILCGGYNVYPRNIEDAVYRHPAIAECVCAGLPDATRGEVVKIWVTFKPGMTTTEDELRTFLKQYISPIEMPKFIEIRNEPLPKTLIGKLSRKDLLAQETAKQS